MTDVRDKVMIENIENDEINAAAKLELEISAISRISDSCRINMFQLSASICLVSQTHCFGQLTSISLLVLLE